MARTADIAPAFLLNPKGKPCTAESIGSLFRKAAVAAGRGGADRPRSVVESQGSEVAHHPVAIPGQGQ